MPAPSRPIDSVDELVARFAAAGKPRAAWRIGVEHEKIGVLVPTGEPVPYEGLRGIAMLFRELERLHAYQPVRESEHTIALARGPLKVTLEPGGQLELSGDPHADGRDIEAEIRGHLADLRAPSDELGLAWLATGFRPFGTLDDVPWVPKGRYRVMREVLATRGRRAHDMMKRTATVQANLDYSDEEDAERKMRAAMSVTSIVTALFAASPLAEGRDTGQQSYRASAWLETDPDRCGLLPFAFERGRIFERYTEWALDVPMLFFYRGDYRSARGLSFRRFMREGLYGEQATIADWDTHLSTLFPEARLKHYMEVRGADSGPLPMIFALPALWKGLLYDDEACRAATGLTAGLSFADRQDLRAAVPAAGLGARVPGRAHTMLELARDLADIASAGLARVSPGELPALEPVLEIARSGRTHADHVREVWTRTPDPAALIAALAYPLTP